jgi:ParB family chromosome partitioning protein
MKMKISDIQMKRRVRSDLGDIDRLCDNMRKNGLLQPIVVNASGLLVSGRRRLQAAKLLGWEEIDVTVVPENDTLRLLEMELDENTFRKDFTPDEVERGIRRRLDLIRYQRMSLVGRIFFKIGRFFRNLFRRGD